MTKLSIIRVLNRYLSSEIPLAELEEWLVSHLQEGLDSENADLIDWIDRLDAELMSVRDGFGGEDDLMKVVDAIVRENETVRSSFVASAKESLVAEAEVTEDVSASLQFNLVVSEHHSWDPVFG